MKAAVIHKVGDVDGLTYDDIPTPTPKPGRLVIEVLSAGMNRLNP